MYINRPSQASSRITSIDLVETPPDLASPHLLLNDHIKTPSLDRPLSNQTKKLSLTDPQREERIAGGSRPGLVLPLPCDARPEAAALSRAERPPTVLDIPETGRLEDTRCPEPSQRRGSHSPRCHSRKQPRNRSSGVYRPKKRSPHRGHWCE